MDQSTYSFVAYIKDICKPRRSFEILKCEAVFTYFTMETPLLNGYSGSGERNDLIGADGDYRPAKSTKDWWAIFCVETLKLWRIGGPIAFNIICQYGVNSLTNIFVGHLGNVELSAISIAQTVISTFSFGFMVSSLFNFPSHLT